MRALLDSRATAPGSLSPSFTAIAARALLQSQIMHTVNMTGDAPRVGPGTRCVTLP